MPAAPASPAARLRRLEAALPKAKKLKRGSTLTAKPMAELIGVTWPVLRGWCDDVPGFEESGVFVRGGNGIEWDFKPVASIRFLMKHFEAEKQARVEAARRIRRAVGGGALEAVPDEYSLDDMAKMVRLSHQVQDHKIRQGELVAAEGVRNPLQRVFSRMQAAGLRAAQEADPNGRWSAETRQAVEDVSRSILLAQERAAQDCLKELNGGAA